MKRKYQKNEKFYGSCSSVIGELLKKFRWILENEELIKKQLNSKIPEVIKRALTAKEYVERLL